MQPRQAGALSSHENLSTDLENPTEGEGLRVRAEVARSPRVALLSRPVLATFGMLCLAALFEWVPQLAPVRVFSAPMPDQTEPAPGLLDPGALSEVGEAEITSETQTQPGLDAAEPARRAQGPIAAPEAALPQIVAEAPPVTLEDQTGHALDGFFRALSETQAKKPGAITRIAHFGDSIVVSDYVSGTLRRMFQAEFGDSGHGYVLVANAWPAYFHNDVYRFASRGWKVSRIVGPVNRDGYYGLGGVSFQAPPGARARMGTAKQGDHGRAVSKFTVVYLQDVAAGGFRLNVDGELHSEVDARSDKKQVGYAIVEVPDGEHELEIVTQGGTTRMFGVVLERTVPGVVLDALGVQGARIRFLDKQDDEHWVEQLRWRRPNLLIYQFGANESGDGFAYPMDEYYETMVAVLEQGKRALPDSSCLVLGAMDRARKEGEALVSMRVIPMLVTEQRKAAKSVGCAFFDTFQAMGGHGAMPTWVRRGLGQADFTHPTGVGSEVLARWIFRALMKSYNEFLDGRAAAPSADAPSQAR